MSVCYCQQTRVCGVGLFTFCSFGGESEAQPFRSWSVPATLLSDKILLVKVTKNLLPSTKTNMFSKVKYSNLEYQSNDKTSRVDDKLENLDRAALVDDLHERPHRWHSSLYLHAYWSTRCFLVLPWILVTGLSVALIGIHSSQQPCINNGDERYCESSQVADKVRLGGANI